MLRQVRRRIPAPQLCQLDPEHCKGPEPGTRTASEGVDTFSRQESFSSCTLHPCPSLQAALVQLGRLDFDDFRLLPEDAVQAVLSDLATLDDWQLALNNAPHILVYFRRCCPDWSLVIRQSSLADIASAQSRLVLRHALLLLKEKSPPLYDALPWHDWDFSIVTKKYRLWQTRFFLAGDGTSAILPKLRKSAGAFVFEPSSTLARYLQRKAELERLKRFRLLPAALPLAAAPGTADIAIIGSLPWLPGADGQQVIREALRIARDVLIVENNPLVRPLPQDELTGLGFVPGTVSVTGLGNRPCWWRRARTVAQSAHDRGSISATPNPES